MPVRRDIIVMGASAGGVEALERVVNGLPADLPAAIFVVLHIPPRSRSMLPEILSRAGPLPAHQAVDGDTIQYGRILIAPPDHHLVIERDCVHLTVGPKEQHHRPCINVTFRSAANSYGEQVIGVVLSGEMDDGTAGLWEVERHGGLTIVQHPEETAFPSMPLSALREVEVDYTVPPALMGPLLANLVQTSEPPPEATSEVEKENTPWEVQLTDLTCPDCRGTIWELKRGPAKD